ncbi:hypothetical protein BK726_16100 [Bacillus thuringiensis serovar londrina]|nr:hypothetical protein BK726_16100 [Bacillus thuringiensis serovar londrina]
MKNSSIYFLNIFLKIYLTNTNECLLYHLRFNIYFEYDVSIYYIPNGYSTHFYIYKNTKSNLTLLK